MYFKMSDAGYYLGLIKVSIKYLFFKNKIYMYSTQLYFFNAQDLKDSN